VNAKIMRFVCNDVYLSNRYFKEVRESDFLNNKLRISIQFRFCITIDFR